MQAAASKNTINILDFVPEAGELAERIATFDWSQTSLGPIESWPQSLRTCVHIMLSSRQPIWIGWGKELIKLYNDPYKSIVGGKHPWALGTPASVVWKDIWKDIEPMLQQVMEQGIGTYVESQLLIMERNGYPEETYYTFSYTPVPGDDGKIAGMFCANTDDTQRIINERQLKTLTRLGKQLTDCKTTDEVVHKAIATLEENNFDFPFAIFRVLDNNQLKLAHATSLNESAAFVPEVYDLDKEDNIVARSMKEALATKKIQLFREPEERAGKMPTGAWSLHSNNSIVMPIIPTGMKDAFGVLSIGLNPYRLFDEKYESFFLLVADQIATSLADVYAFEEERKRARALAEIDRAKTTFFSNISHELRTPLTLMLAPIEDVLSDAATDSENKIKLEIAYHNARRMLKLVNNLLDFSRLEAGRMNVRFEQVNLSDLTTDLASTFRAAIEKAGMQLEVITDDNVMGYVDTDMWEKIVLNLLSNAFKYTHQGHIRVSLQQQEHEVQLCISDTGIGIPQEELGKIFERFHRVQSTGGRSQEGTGIGLALVQELVRIHGGTISAESRTGEGSVFTITLPTGKAHLPLEQVTEYSGESMQSLHHAGVYLEEMMKWLPEEEQHEEGTADINIDDKKPHIVLADDNADMRTYLKRLLSRHYEVTTVDNGRAALDAVHILKPDLVLSDVMMPELSGFELVKRLKAEEHTQYTPVILLSARAGEEATIEGLATGADDYLVKPFSAGELLSRIDSNLKIAAGRAHALRQVEELVARRTEELRIANQHLMQSEERYHRMVEEVEDYAIILLDKNGVIQNWNRGAEKIKGYKEEEIVGQNFELFYLPEDRDRNIPKLLLAEAAANGKATREGWRLKKGGDTFWGSILITALHDDAGNVIGFSKVTRDLTERKLAEDRLREYSHSLEAQNRELEQFAYAASHDMKEPLRKIHFFGTSLQDRTSGQLDDKSADYLARILASTRRMSNLIDNLLNYSKTMANTEATESVDLNAVVRDVLMNLHNDTEHDDIRFSVDALPTIMGIPFQCAQLMDNLVHNAIKYRQADRECVIRIQYQQMNGHEVQGGTEPVYHKVSVIDNGIGFEQQYAEKIFEIFQRLGTSGKSGAGIGLAICKRIMLNHNGLIQALGTPGEGARFDLYFPATILQQPATTY